MSDAAHLLTDFASFGISLVAMHLTVKRRTKKLSFGWYRAGTSFTCIYNVSVHGDANLQIQKGLRIFASWLYFSILKLDQFKYFLLKHWKVWYIRYINFIVTFRTVFLRCTYNEKSITCLKHNTTLISEIIGALVSILFLWILTGVLVYLGVERIINPDYTIDPLIMLITASVGVVINVM